MMHKLNSWRREAPLDRQTVGRLFYKPPPAEADASVTYLRSTLAQYKQKQPPKVSSAPKRKLSANTN